MPRSELDCSILISPLSDCTDNSLEGIEEIEVLQWRNAVEAIEKVEGAIRWYLDPEGDEDNDQCEVVGTKVIELDDNDEWRCEIKGQEPGLYWVYLCVSFEDVDMDVVKSMTFDVGKKSPRTKISFIVGSSCETLLSSAEIRDIPKQKFTSLRLHRQLQGYGADVKLLITIEAATTAKDKLVTFDLHYIELQPVEFQSNSDQVLYGYDAPDQFIGVGADGTTMSPTKIIAYSFSDSGTHAVTLYYCGGKAYIDIWDLNAIDHTISTKAPRIHTVPCSQVSFPFTASAEFLNHLNGVRSFDSIWIAISNSASQVAVGSKTENELSIPFSAFISRLAAPADQDMTKPWSLVPVTVACSSLPRFYGHGDFYSGDCGQTSEQHQRFMATDGSILSLYSTGDTWTRSYIIDLSSTGQLWSERFFKNGLRGQLFAWLSVNRVVTIWDLGMRSIASSIYVPNTDYIAGVAFSQDGSTVAIFTWYILRVYDSTTGTELGIYKETEMCMAIHKVTFQEGHIIVLRGDTGYGPRLSKLTVVSQHDMSVVYTLECHGDYGTLFSPPSGTPLVSYARGSILNIKILRDIPSLIRPYRRGCDEACELQDLHRLKPWDLPYHLTIQDSKFTIDAEPSPRNQDDECHVILKISADVDGTTKTMSVSVGDEAVFEPFWFSPSNSKVVHYSDGVLKVFDLSAANGNICELSLLWKLHDGGGLINQSAQVCKRCERIQFTFKSYSGDDIGVMTIPISVTDTFETKEQDRLNNAVSSSIFLYTASDSSGRTEITRYLAKYIRPSTKHSTSCLSHLCRAWTPKNRIHLEALLTTLLPNNRVTWVPNIRSTKDEDPFSIVFKIAKTQPTATRAAKIIIDYCLNHASQSGNLSFLSPVFLHMHDILFLMREESPQIMGRIAFILVPNRGFIMNNHVLVQPPTLRLKFWTQNTKPLVKTKNPIMQLHYTAGEPNASNDEFTRPIFAASFGMLWEVRCDEPMAAHDSTTKGPLLRVHRLLSSAMYRFKPKQHVKRHDFTLEMLDNPAIAALVEYKWNTIGFKYWLVRFFCHCCFYQLVLVAVFMQIYGDTRKESPTLYVAIAACSIIFFWFELMQCFQGWRVYIKSIYNIVDVLAYGLPLAAGVNQLLIINRITFGDVPKDLNAGLFGFSVPLISLHLLFELRVNKTVCHFVVIIIRIISGIRIFFFIFFAGIIAFTIAILHVLHSCPLGTCDPPFETEFPKHFYQAFTSAFFLMGGRYDPIDMNLASKNWVFLTLMITYFFFTVILMLNVLIALINVKFERGDMTWRQAWVANRLRVAEVAENLSYIIPEFRETSNYFPREIYYSMTSQQAKAYKKQCFRDRDEDEDEDPEVPKSGSGTGLFGDSIDIATTATRPSSILTRTTASSDSAISIPAPESTSTNGGETSPRAATHGATAEAASSPAQLMITVAATELDVRLRELDASLRAQFAEELDARLREQELSLRVQFAEELDGQMQKLDTRMQQLFNVLLQQTARIPPTAGEESTSALE